MEWMLLMVGLAVDVSGHLHAMQEARATAREAARVGGQQVQTPTGDMLVNQLRTGSLISVMYRVILGSEPELLDQTALKPADVSLVGFHGQTILHRPADGLTWQIGDGAHLARGIRRAGDGVVDGHARLAAVARGAARAAAARPARDAPPVVAPAEGLSAALASSCDRSCRSSDPQGAVEDAETQIHVGRCFVLRFDPRIQENVVRRHHIMW